MLCAVLFARDEGKKGEAAARLALSPWRAPCPIARSARGGAITDATVLQGYDFRLLVRSSRV